MLVAYGILCLITCHCVGCRLGARNKQAREESAWANPAFLSPRFMYVILVLACVALAEGLFFYFVQHRSSVMVITPLACCVGLLTGFFHGSEENVML